MFGLSVFDKEKGDGCVLFHHRKIKLMLIGFLISLLA